ncbi:MAG: hypothetical protein ABJA37_09630 [Ferruginibacter sp.]
MDNLIYIDTYFNKEKTTQDKEEFESRVLNDAAFAEEVAFYLSANNIIIEQVQAKKKEKFREIYQQQKVISINERPVKKLWKLLAAASVATLLGIAAWWMIAKNDNPRQYAEQYIERNMQTLGVNMGSGTDSLQAALGLFNEGKLTKALVQFQSIIKNDPGNSNAKKYAGITSLRLQNYDEALQYFRELGNIALYSNPGKFYEAITLVKRNKPGDTILAKQVLQQIIDDDLEGKNEALQLLKKIN